MPTELERELLPCPFCGTAEPQVVEQYAGTKQSQWSVICNGHWCDASVSSDGSGSLESAIETWNRRTDAAALQAQQPVTLREVTMEDMANACDAYRREQPASNDLAHPKAMFAALRAILPHGIPALAELDAQPAPAPVQVDKRDREADRQRFPDAQFNVWLDEGISDCGHTVWDAIGDVCDAWQGWKARQFYAHPQPPSIPEPSELRKVAKRNLRSMIERGSDDKALMLKCLEELS